MFTDLALCLHIWDQVFVFLLQPEHGEYSLTLKLEQQSRLKECATPFLLQECTKGSQPSLPRLIAMLHPECPVPALAKHFRSSDWRERCAIAQHPSTPPNTLAILAREGNRVVRAAANENLAGQEQA